jgi:1-acyl-sn-glycerol-3-phosphate acyltransferase
MRVTTGEIGAFNKGSFHLATSLHAAIVPIYIAIPREINPGMGYDAKPGSTDIYFLPPIDTRRGSSPTSRLIATPCAISLYASTTRCDQQANFPSR